jgi:hypothetical protein
MMKMEDIPDRLDINSLDVLVTIGAGILTGLLSD